MAPSPTTTSRTSSVSPARRKLVLGIVGSSLFLTIANGTSLNVALPFLQEDLGVPFAHVQWVMLAFLLSIIGFLPFVGHLGDTRDKRSLFAAGMVLFAAGAVLSGMAETLPMLVFTRFLQGAGVALAQGLSFAILAQVFPEGERGRAFGLLASLTTLAIIAGPAAGGAVLSVLSWRWLFWLAAPVALAFSLLAWRLIPSTTGTSSEPRSWIDGELFRRPPVVAGLLGELAVFAATHSFFFLLPFVLSGTLGFSPLAIGLVLTSNPIVQSLVSPWSGSYSDRQGPLPAIFGGLVFLLIGFAAMSLIEPNSSTGVVALCLVPFGVGMGLFVPANAALVLGATPASRTATASSALALARRLAQAAGLAVVSAVWSNLPSATSGSPTEQLQGFTSVLLVLSSFIVLGLLANLLGRSRQTAPSNA